MRKSAQSRGAQSRADHRVSVAPRTPELPSDYAELLERLKREIGAARTRAALAVNEELIGLYWRIGREILVRQFAASWPDSQI
ncbi:MAG: hypothetical protein ACYCX7_06570, partial [Solirubrobacteraceae bacterium]